MGMNIVEPVRLSNDSNQVVEVELESFVSSFSDENKALIDITESKIIELENEINKINEDIEGFTSHADKTDYLVSAISGVLAGFVDSFFVGRFDIKEGKAWSHKETNKFVDWVAKQSGYSGKRHAGAVKFLEDKYKVASDSIWKGTGSGISAKSHHLDDISHHPTITGLISSLFTQFSGLAIFVNRDGDIHLLEADPSCIGANVFEKISRGIVDWLLHLVSDVSGSRITAGTTGGMGLPGPIMSTLKELSMIPGLDNSDFSKYLNDLFIKGISIDGEILKFDFRGELAIGHQLVKQAIPVALNEIIVRSFYFLRRVLQEYQKNKSLDGINWKKCLPFKNATITRMMLVASATFTIFDVADAAIRSALEKGATLGPQFWKSLLFRVNIVGLGRLAFAIGDEITTTYKRARLKSVRMQRYSELIELQGLSLYAYESEIWIRGRDAVVAVDQMIETARVSVIQIDQSWRSIQRDMIAVDECITRLRSVDPSLCSELEDILESV